MEMGHFLFHHPLKFYWTFPKAIRDFGHLLVAVMVSPAKILTLYTKTWSSLLRTTLGRPTFEWNLLNLRHLIQKTKEHPVVKIVRMKTFLIFTILMYVTRFKR